MTYNHYHNSGILIQINLGINSRDPLKNISLNNKKYSGANETEISKLKA